MDFEERRETFLTTLTDFYNISREIIDTHISENVIAKSIRTNEEFLESMSVSATSTSATTHVTFIPPTVTTMTITGKFRYDEEITSDLPIEYIRKKLDEENDLGLYIGVQKVRKHRKDTYKKKVQHDKRKFRHQVPIKHGGKSAKLFYNGSIHVTGITNLVDFVHMMTMVASFIHDITDKELLVVLEDFKISMINASSLVTDLKNFPLSFPPNTITSVLRENGQNVDFDSERFPGVKIIISDDNGKKAATGCIFQTGSLSIIGARKPIYIAQIFEVIVKNLDTMWTLGLSASKPRTTTSRIPLEISHGYLANTYKLCL